MTKRKRTEETGKKTEDRKAEGESPLRYRSAQQLFKVGGHYQPVPSCWRSLFTGRLRVVPLSLNPSCVMGLVRRAWHKKMIARDPGGEKRGFHAAIFFAVFFRVTHDGLRERGTTRSLVHRLYVHFAQSASFAWKKPLERGLLWAERENKQRLYITKNKNFGFLSISNFGIFSPKVWNSRSKTRCILSF